MKKLEDKLQTLAVRCDTEAATTQAQARMLEGDLRKAEQLVNVTSTCKNGFSFLQFASEGASDDGPPTLRLESDVAKGALQEVLRRVCPSADSLSGNVGQSASLMQAAVLDVDWPGRGGSEVGAARNRNPRACELGDMPAPRCASLGLGLRRARNHISEQLTVLTNLRRREADKCQAHRDRIQVQITLSKTEQDHANEDLAAAMSERGGLTERRDSHKERAKLLGKEMEETQEQCRMKLDTLKSELTNALRVRQGLYLHASGSHPGIQDCEVTEWVYGSCTKKCMESPTDDVGALTATRTVLTYNDPSGMPCPPLEARLPCGRKPCPVDCQMGEWEGWSSCTAPCGGGTQTRNRYVKRPARNGGRICTSRSEIRLCNSASCDVECQLFDWTMWSPCSRACKFETAATGRQSRVKRVKHAAKGAGTCPKKSDSLRLQINTCNTSPCPPSFTCAGEHDVLMLLDGSDVANFTAQLDLARQLVNRSEEGVRFGVQAYGSTTSFIADHEDQRSEVLNKLLNAKRPGGDPSLAAALARIAASPTYIPQPVVGKDGTAQQLTLLLVTNGEPMEELEAEEVIGKIKAWGVRVLVALVDENRAPGPRKHACRMASSPCEGNVEAFPSWEGLAVRPGQLMAALCGEIKTPPPPSILDAVSDATALSTGE